MSLQHSPDGAPFLTPRIDDHSYRLVTLENGLKVLLVTDPKADKAAAACDVRVGSMSDPEDIAGLAHFCEHMLFYSSEKYPEEDEYSKFISEHGGHTNAYTSNESTNYHFDVNWEHLEPALDRFAQFFICPLISEDGVEREANAVDSEHGKNLNSDAWRKLQLWKATASPAHPFSRFSTGNLDTLIHTPRAAGTNVHERVKQFHAEHYSAGVTRVVVVSRHTLDQLEGLVREKFGAVRDTGVAPPSFSDAAVTARECGTLLKMVPQRDTHSIELQWATVAEGEHYDAAPCHYVSHLLGHEGEGSVFAWLKAKGWASGLVAGEAGTSYSSRSFFMVRIDLTEEGQRHAKEAVAAVFRYIQLLRGEGGISEKIWGELRALSEMKFHFRDKQPPYSYASSLAHCMQVYREEDLLTGMYGVPLRFDPDLIRRVVEDLTPEGARVMWASKALEEECTLSEQWYGTRYSLQPLPKDWLECWREGGRGEAQEEGDPPLHLPRPNPFIPRQFDLIQEAPAAAPSPLHGSDLVRVWHHPDTSFQVPKAALYLHFQLAESYVTPGTAVMTQLITKLLNDYLSELSYPAELAGLGYSLRPTVSGIILTAYGYNHTLPALAQAVLDQLLGFRVREERFQVVKEKLGRDFANMKYDQPYQYALYCMNVLLEARRWHISDYQSILPSITPGQLQAFYPRLLSRCHVELLAAGNIAPSEATAFAEGLQGQLQERCGSLPPFPSQAPEARVVRLRPGAPALLTQQAPNPANENSAAVVSFQLAQDDARCNALAELVAHMGKRDAFHQLRTVEQLGYLTFCTTFWMLTVRSVLFIVQSTAHTAAYLDSRIEAFLPQLDRRLADMPDSEFSAHVEELCKTKLEAPKRLREAVARVWREIDDGSMKFERQEEEVAELRKLTKDDVIAFFRENILHPASRRKLSVHIEAARPPAAGGASQGGQEGSSQLEGAGSGAAGGAHGDQGAGSRGGAAAATGAGLEVIGDMYAFKRRQELFPSLK